MSVPPISIKQVYDVIIIIIFSLQKKGPVSLITVVTQLINRVRKKFKHAYRLVQRNSTGHIKLILKLYAYSDIYDPSVFSASIDNTQSSQPTVNVTGNVAAYAGRIKLLEESGYIFGFRDCTSDASMVCYIEEYVS